jgi:hypothetical protein
VKWGAGEENKNDEKRTVQALEAERLTAALGPNGYQVMVAFDKSLETLADKLVGTQGRDGTFLIKLAGPVLPNGRSAHWMAFRRATDLGLASKNRSEPADLTVCERPEVELHKWVYAARVLPGAVKTTASESASMRMLTHFIVQGRVSGNVRRVSIGRILHIHQWTKPA